MGILLGLLLTLIAFVASLKSTPHKQITKFTEQLWRVFIQQSFHAQYLERLLSSPPSKFYLAIYKKQVEAYKGFALAINENIDQLDKKMVEETIYNPMYKQELRTKIYDLKVKFYRLVQTLYFVYQPFAKKEENNTIQHTQLDNKKQDSKQLVSTDKKIDQAQKVQGNKNNRNETNVKQIVKQKDQFQSDFDSQNSKDKNNQGKKSLTKNQSRNSDQKQNGN